MRIVDLSRHTAGSFCSKLFAMAGESVTRFAPASESDSPAGAPFLSELRRAYLRVEPTIAVDWNDARSRARVDEAIAAADAVIDSFRAGRYDSPYDEARIRSLSEDAVHLTVSPFGLDGPYSGYDTSSLVEWAAGGYLAITGEPERAPLAGPPELCGYVAGYAAAVALEAGLRRRATRPGPVHVDLSVMEALLSVHNGSFSRLASGGDFRRMGNDVGPATYPHVTYAGPDGRLFLGIVTDEEWDRFAIAIERPELAADPGFRSGEARKANWEAVDEIVAAWCEKVPVDAAADRLQALHIPATRECSASHLLEDAQLAARAFLRPLSVGARTGTAPGDPIRVAEAPAGPVGDATSAPQRAGDGPASSGLPLEGLVVLDVSVWWAGPSAARILGDLGARVIRVETPVAVRGDHLQGVMRLVHEKMNRNKLGIALDLKTEEGRALARRLATGADVLIQNFRPGALDRIGLGYSDVAALNPGIVYVSLSGFGADGPKAQWGSYGTLIEAASSIRARTHYPGGPGTKLGHPLPDGVGGLAGAGAALRGLRRREATGVGVHYDLSQLETYVAVCGEGVLAASLGDAPAPGAKGEGDERVLRCAGDDDWIAVTLPDAEAAARVVAAFGAGTADARPADANDESAWSLLARTASGREKSKLARELQELGIPAFPVLAIAELARDAHLAARGFFIEVEIDGMQGALPGSPYRLTDGDFVHFARPAPMPGENSAEVLARDLGLAAADIESLVQRRIAAIRE